MARVEAGEHLDRRSLQSTPEGHKDPRRSSRSSPFSAIAAQNSQWLDQSRQMESELRQSGQLTNSLALAKRLAQEQVQRLEQSCHRGGEREVQAAPAPPEELEGDFVAKLRAELEAERQRSQQLRKELAESDRARRSLAQESEFLNTQSVALTDRLKAAEAELSAQAHELRTLRPPARSEGDPRHRQLQQQQNYQQQQQQQQQQNQQQQQKQQQHPHQQPPLQTSLVESLESRLRDSEAQLRGLREENHRLASAMASTHGGSQSFSVPVGGVDTEELYRQSAQLCTKLGEAQAAAAARTEQLRRCEEQVAWYEARLAGTARLENEFLELQEQLQELRCAQRAHFADGERLEHVEALEQNQSRLKAEKIALNVELTKSRAELAWQLKRSRQCEDEALTLRQELMHFQQQKALADEELFHQSISLDAENESLVAEVRWLRSRLMVLEEEKSKSVLTDESQELIAEALRQNEVLQAEVRTLQEALLRFDEEATKRRQEEKWDVRLNSSELSIKRHEELDPSLEVSPCSAFGYTCESLPESSPASMASQRPQQKWPRPSSPGAGMGAGRGFGGNPFAAGAAARSEGNAGFAPFPGFSAMGSSSGGRDGAGGGGQFSPVGRSIGGSYPKSSAASGGSLGTSGLGSGPGAASALHGSGFGAGGSGGYIPSFRQEAGLNAGGVESQLRLDGSFLVSEPSPKRSSPNGFGSPTNQPGGGLFQRSLNSTAGSIATVASDLDAVRSVLIDSVSDVL